MTGPWSFMRLPNAISVVVWGQSSGLSQARSPDEVVTEDDV